MQAGKFTDELQKCGERAVLLQKYASDPDMAGFVTMSEHFNNLIGILWQLTPFLVVYTILSWIDMVHDSLFLDFQMDSKREGNCRVQIASLISRFRRS